MKKLIKFSSILVLILMVASCSKDSDGSGISGIPSGEIVPVQEREFVLTGVDSGSANKSKQAKNDTDVVGRTWKLIIRKAWVSGNCAALLAEEGLTLEDVNQEDFTTAYFKFGTDGTVETSLSISGPYSNAGDWSWVSAKKDKIIVQDDTYTITALNNSQLIVGYKQSFGGCSFTTYQSFTR